ncbi:MAG: efflux RND transporter permease subunit [Planctomycetota bacterium]
MSFAAFGVRNPVPANLLMFGLLAAGLVAASTLRKQFFPEVESESATIQLAYPGATPEEIEDTLAIKVEDAIFDLDEVDELNSTVGEGGGGIVVNFVEGQDPDKALDELERRIDALQDLPDEAEEITVTLNEPRLPTIMLAVYGDLEELALKRAALALKDDLQTLPDMGEIAIDGSRGYELSVNVRQSALLEQGVPITAVSNAIADWMREVPGGTVRNAAGNTNVRTMGVTEHAPAIEQIVVKATMNGDVVKVGDVATVTEGFTDTGITNRFNGKPAVYLTVFKIGDQDIVKMAEMVRAYVAVRSGEDADQSVWSTLTKPHVRQAIELAQTNARPLPAGADLAVFTDLARFVEGRLDLLLRNAFYGALLVFGTLLIFLNWRVAFWVGIGLITALAGTLVLMGFMDVTLNLLTMFGLIVVLGLLVDDAIVVSENIQRRHEDGEPALEAAIKGAGQVQWPVVATVMTSIVAFLPLTWIEGNIGDLLGALPIVVACALIMSLIECLLILPSHMGHSLIHRDQHRERYEQGHGGKHSFFQRFEERRDAIINDKVVPTYAKALALALRLRYVFVAGVLGVLLVSAGMVAGGRVPFEFLPQNDAESIVVNVRLPIGTPITTTADVSERIEAVATALPEFQSISVTLGQSANIDTGETSAYSPHIAQIFLELTPVETPGRRPSPQVIQDIRDSLVGKLDEVDRITFEPISGGPGGADISVKLRGPDVAELQRASAELKATLLGFADIADVNDDNDVGQPEQRIVPRPADAAAVGLTPTDIALQVRGFLFGLEPHTFAAEREDIDVRVRIDEDTRRSLSDIENAWLVTPTGTAVPLTEVADIVSDAAYATIKRNDRERVIYVSAYVREGVSPESVTAELDLAALRTQFPDVDIMYSGRQEQMGDAFASLPLGAGAAAVMIYIILAWLFGSYLQPLTVMAVIPFSLIGAVWGHFVLGYSLTFLSLIGLVALAGIVVNDSLIYVQFFNERRRAGVDVYHALLDAGRARLRAIFLTTVTTVLGLTPLILETSFQARFLIPMAISIAGGLITATVLILGVLPCLMLMLDDVKRATRFLWFGDAGEHRVYDGGDEQETRGDTPRAPGGDTILGAGAV